MKSHQTVNHTELEQLWKDTTMTATQEVTLGLGYTGILLLVGHHRPQGVITTAFGGHCQSIFLTP